MQCESVCSIKLGHSLKEICLDQAGRVCWKKPSSCIMGHVGSCVFGALPKLKSLCCFRFDQSFINVSISTIFVKLFGMSRLLEVQKQPVY